MRPGQSALVGNGRHEPRHGQRRARGRSPQRRHDGARRLRRRAPAAAPAWSCCRSSTAWRSWRRTGSSTATRSWRRCSTASRAPRASGAARPGRAHPARRGDLRPGLDPDARGAGRAGCGSVPRARQGACCSTSTTSTTSCGSRTSWACGARRPTPRRCATRSRACRCGYQRLRAGASRRPTDRRRPGRTWRSPRWAGPSSTGWATRRAACWPRACRATSPRSVSAAGAEAILLRATLEAHEVPTGSVWVADPFLATAPGDRHRRCRGAAAGRAAPGQRPQPVRDGFARFGLLDDRVRFLQGRPAEHARRCTDRPAGAAAPRARGWASTRRPPSSSSTTACHRARR